MDRPQFSNLQNSPVPNTPDLVLSLLDEDSGLGMECDMFEDSPAIVHNKVVNSKKKRNNALDTPASYCKRKCLKAKNKNVSKRSLFFDIQVQNSDNRKDSLVTTDDIAVEGCVLTGDGQQQCCLPTIQGRFHDLRYITPSTMADVLNGKFDDVIGSYRIIDSRYSYEFEGGHIKGAENIHNKDDILEFFRTPIGQPDGKRHILIFHCEFSSERGPKMCRFLRNHDREINAENYPALCYPEIYILKGGYIEFYENYMTYCTPMNYVPMLSKDHKEDLRHFRSNSKSWYAQKKIKSGSKLFC